MRTHFLLSILLLSGSLPSLAQRTANPQVVVQPSQPPTASPMPPPVPGSYRFRLDSLLTALDKTQVPTGTLYDRVFPLARLDVFGQTAADTSRFEHFLQATQELWYASYNYTALDASPHLRVHGREQSGPHENGAGHVRAV